MGLGLGLGWGVGARARPRATIYNYKKYTIIFLDNNL